MTEHELENLFSTKPKSNSTRYLYWLLLFLALVLFWTYFINISAINSQVSYWFSTKVQNTSYENSSIAKIAQNPSQNQNPEVNIPNNSLLIDKINLKAPITFNVANEAISVEQNLKNGVIHLSGTAHPGEIGNVFITGHSSNYVWESGNYNAVFALLNQLKNGDLITIKYNNNVFIYEVNDKKIVLPTDTSILNSSNLPTLTLMTCWPVGSNSKRLAIFSKQIFPKVATLPTRTNSQQKLPNINR